MPSESSDASISSSRHTLGADEGNNAEKDAERKTLARKENKAVAWLRGLVFFVLLVTTALVSTGVFLFTMNDQEEDFEHEFEAHATKILESFHTTVERKLEALDALAVAYTSYAIGTGASWPNVTLPDFEIRAANTRILSDSAVINFYPLVTDETRLGYEQYVRDNRDDYFDNSFVSGVYQREVQDAKFGHSERRDLRERDLQADNLRERIENLNADGSTSESPEGSGPYLPVWQLSPTVPMKSTLNFNVLSHPAGAGAYYDVLQNHKAVMDVASNLDGEHLGQTGAYFKLVLSLSQYRYDIDKLLVDPTSSLGYPIFDSFDHENRKIVGAFGTNLYWKLYFENILPPNAKGIHCILENTRGQTFTYRIDGAEATYLGSGDLHDPKYDHLELRGDVAEYIATRASPETRSFTSVDLNSEYCDYTLRVFPSQDTEDEFVNSEPMILTIVVICVFLFTSFVFVTYDCLVARRQRIVMNRAVASSAIVSSLFPSQVRDKIYEENEDKAKKDWKHNENKVKGLMGQGDAEVASSARPIAEVFDQTTILFADLAGFTGMCYDAFASDSCCLLRFASYETCVFFVHFHSLERNTRARTSL